MGYNVIEEESFGIIPLTQEEGIWKVFLILHNKGNHWAFPKGHRDSHETAFQTAVRELKEETGLDVVRCLLDTPIIEQYQFRKQQQLVMKKVSYFPAIVAGVLKLQEEEIREGKWLTLEEALTVLSFKEGRSICRQIMALLNIIG